MLTAIFGLVGVVVGGLLTGGVELALERYRRSAQIKVAKRLVLDELHNIWTHLDLLDKGGLTPQAMPAEEQARFLPTTDWMTYREPLASGDALSDDEWIALSNLMRSAASLRTVLFALPPLSPLPAVVDIAGLRDLAVEVYQHHAHEHPDPHHEIGGAA
jgi:hypothetical protein